MIGFTSKLQAAIGMVLAFGFSAAPGEVVYENTQGAVNIDHCPSSTEIGDEITLADNACGVTQLDLAFTGPIGNVDLVVRLRANDALEDKPGTVLFDSGPLTIAAVNAGFNTFSVAVPNVTVPATFTWTIQRVGGPNICIPRFDPPTVGSSDDFFWVNNLGVFWFKSNTSFQDNFYARVVAGGGGLAITCPADAILECPADTSPAFTGEAAAEGCGTVSVGFVDSSVPGCGSTETITRTWTADDGAGGTATCVQTITVVDTTNPAVACPPDAMGLECPADTGVNALGAASGSDTCGGVAIDSSDVGLAGCGGTETITRTWTAADDCGNAASCDQFIETVDTIPPTITVDTSPITVVDADCSGEEPVALPPAAGADDCDGAVAVTDDAPATFAAGTTTSVTYTAEDDCGNTATAQRGVTVEFGAAIEVTAREFTVGLGNYPGVTRDALVGILVGAYDDSSGSCARTQIDSHSGSLWWAVPDIIQNCTPVSTVLTGGDGTGLIDVPPSDYIVAAHFDSDGDTLLDQYLAQRVMNLACGDVAQERLLMITLASGRRLGCKYTRLTGSELLIVEPEEVIWDSTEQQYPFVLDADGAWEVTVSVTPPEGFVADYNALSEGVADEIEAVQFTVTEVGSELVPLKAEFQVNHNRRAISVHSEVGIALTPAYARSRGFNVFQLRRQGLIVDQVGPDGQPQRMASSDPIRVSAVSGDEGLTDGD